MMATKKRMGGMKLSDFGGHSATVQPEPESEVEAPPSETPAIESKEPAKVAKRKPAKKEEPFVTVNIKIKKSQQDWLADTAFQVRQNNETPVPASERVYPQHLIQTAIDLLKTSDVDWETVKNVEDLRQVLKL
jgi:hypothetical protein